MPDPEFETSLDPSFDLEFEKAWVWPNRPESKTLILKH